MSEPARRLLMQGRRVVLRSIGWTQRHRPWGAGIPSAFVDHVGVFDGRTLTGSGMVKGLPPQAHNKPLALQFTGEDGETKRVDLQGTEWHTGRARFRLAVRLEGPAGVGLRTGRWVVGVVPVLPDGALRVLPVRGSWRVDDRGPTLWNPRSPVTGLHYRPAADDGGNLVIWVRRRPAHAEVDRITVGDGSIDVDGRFIGADTGDLRSPSVVLTAAGDGRTLSLPVRRNAGEFSFAIPLDSALSAASAWEAHVAIDNARGSGVLPLGKALSDLRHLDRVVSFPSAELPTGATARPAYRDDGAFVVRIHQSSTGKTTTG